MSTQRRGMGRTPGGSADRSTTSHTPLLATATSSRSIATAKHGRSGRARAARSSKGPSPRPHASFCTTAQAARRVAWRPARVVVAMRAGTAPPSLSSSLLLAAAPAVAVPRRAAAPLAPPSAPSGKRRSCRSTVKLVATCTRPSSSSTTITLRLSAEGLSERPRCDRGCSLLAGPRSTAGTCTNTRVPNGSASYAGDCLRRSSAGQRPRASCEWLIAYAAALMTYGPSASGAFESRVIARARVASVRFMRSTRPFCSGVSGADVRWLMPSSASHERNASLQNSVPLSLTSVLTARPAWRETKRACRCTAASTAGDALVFVNATQQ